jgi:hypothetical protein
MRSRGRVLALLTAIGGVAAVSGACTEMIPLPRGATPGDDATVPVVVTSHEQDAAEPDGGSTADAGAISEVGPSSPTDAGDDASCSKVWLKQSFDLQRPQLVIAFDRSQSMMTKMFGNKRRRDAVRDELMPVLRNLEGGVEFGYTEFPMRGACNPATTCCASKVILQPSADNAFGIEKQLSCTTAGPTCLESPAARPVADVLAHVRDFFTPTFDPDKESFVLVVTDGAPSSCVAGDPMACDAASEATQLFNLTKARTIVLAVGEEAKSNACLDSLAMAGQLPRPSTTPPYAWAADAAELRKVVEEALLPVKDETCRITLTVSPGNTDHMDLTVNGRSLTRDPAGKEGWNFDPVGTTDIRLYGSACERVQAGFTQENEIRVWQLCARCNGSIVCP